MKILPHRDGMLLVDEVEEQDGTALGRYHVRGDEWFLQGHFPGHPVVPGVILCEMLAQATCVLLRDRLTPGTVPLFGGMNHVRFRAPVHPGDTLCTQSRIVKSRHPFYFAQARGTVNGVLCVELEYSIALTEG